MKDLGTPKTIGELKELIKNYPDEISFGFFNQPMQTLSERKFNGQTFVVFSEQPKELLCQKCSVLFTGFHHCGF